MAGSTNARTALKDHAPGTGHRNEVALVGRLAAPPLERNLPSGDVLVTWRLIVDRPPRAARRGAAVDAIECASSRGDIRRRSNAWRAGDLLEVTGALRRRFWRSPAGPASRCEVEVERARKMAPGR